MIPVLSTAAGSIGRYRGVWTATVVGVFIGYFVLLLATAMLHFGQLPNYIRVYDLFANYAQIMHYATDFTDTISIMAAERWLEIGYRNPRFFGIAQWSLTLMPAKAALILLLGVLAATIVVLLLDNHRAGCARGAPLDIAVATGGAASLGLSSATLTWVVCCAAPSWVVVLSLLGLSSGTALALAPLGGLLRLGGMVLMAAVAAHLAYRRAVINANFAWRSGS